MPYQHPFLMGTKDENYWRGAGILPTIPQPMPPPPDQMQGAGNLQGFQKLPAGGDQQQGSHIQPFVENQEKLARRPPWQVEMEQELPSPDTKSPFRNWLKKLPANFGKNLKDPVRTAFAAGMMDQSWTGGRRKWNISGQIGNALGAMSKAQAAQNKNYKALTFHDVDLPGGKKQLMWRDPNTGQTGKAGSIVDRWQPRVTPEEAGKKSYHQRLNRNLADMLTEDSDATKQYDEYMKKFWGRRGTNAANLEFRDADDSEFIFKEDYKDQLAVKNIELRDALHRDSWLKEQEWRKKNNMGPRESLKDWKKKRKYQMGLDVKGAKLKEQQKALSPGVYEYTHRVTGKKAKITHSQLAKAYKESHPTIDDSTMILLEMMDVMPPERRADFESRNPDAMGRFEQWIFDEYGIDMGTKSLKRGFDPEEVQHPKTQADFDALKKGEIFIDPASGKKFRKGG